MRRFACLLLAVLLTVSLCGCGGTQESRLELFAMDTYMVITAEGGDTEEAVKSVSREISRLENALSRTIDTSSVSRLNDEGGARLDEETASLLAAALTYSADTNGAFDVTIAPLVELWGITSDDPRVPSQEEIDALLPLVGSEHIHLDGREATLDEDCAIDLGGIAKGFASDKAADILSRSGADRACANLGGNVYVYSREGHDAWNVAIQDPQGKDDYVCILSLTDHFVVTSGGYQRYFTGPDGTVYQHILDPKTGYPVQGDLLSASVILPRSGDELAGTRADAYSTALYVMGESGAADFWRAHRDFDMVLVTTDGRVVYTPGLASVFHEAEGVSYVCEQLAD